jgi:ATP-dependent 26S proteasome regulatory subunit
MNNMLPSVKSALDEAAAIIAEKEEEPAKKRPKQNDPSYKKMLEAQN